MKKRTVLLGFITCLCFGIGVMFEFFHWPFRGVIMLLGFLILNLGLFPSIFIEKYKKAL